MAKSKITLCVILVLCIYPGFAKTHFDSLFFKVEGQVIHAETKQPIKASIIFQSVPYGSKMGVVKGSAYSFVITKGESYTIVAKAEGFIPGSEKVVYNEIDNTGHIIKNIELSPKKEDNTIRLERLIFAQGKYEISTASYDELDKLAAMLKENDMMVIQLEGHTDFKGNPRQNMKLSQQRVIAVKKYLTNKGIEKKRIKTKAFGGTQPISKNRDPESIKKNRRVEVRILEN